MSLQQALDAVLSGSSAGKCETDTLDFKREKTVPKEAWTDLAEAAVCFANAIGQVGMFRISRKTLRKFQFSSAASLPTRGSLSS